MHWRNVTLGFLILIVAGVLPAAAQITGPTEIETAFRGESAPLSELAASFVPDTPLDIQTREVPNKLPAIDRSDAAPNLRLGDPVRQTVPLKSSTVPLPSLSFEGTTDQDNGEVLGFLIVPPDTEADVGRNFVIQMNNNVFEIFDKDDGTSVLGPLPNNIFFTGTGSLCEETNDGDPLVMFDQERKRWFLSQFALFDENGGGHHCFAVSKTRDPLGAYFLYDFVVATPQFGGLAALNDYPKMGNWRDGLFYSENEFEFFPGLGFAFVGVGVVAFDKKAMTRGRPAVGVKFFIPFTGEGPVAFTLQPSHWEGRQRPRRGQPNVFFQAVDSAILGGPGDGYNHWAFKADFRNPANSTLTPLGVIPAPEFDSDLCFGSRNCINQPSPGTAAEGNGLDSLDISTMYRAQFRSFHRGRSKGGGDDDDDSDSDSDSDGGRRNFQSVVLNHTVDADGADTAGARWVELRNTSNGDPTGWFIHQTSTFAPADGNSRWMGSIAQDRKQNIALGFSVSGENTFPSVRYTGRSAGDPLGEMGSEVECHAGTGSQINSSNRWGDYATMSVDPQDNCTFWFTQEYYEETGAFDFKTRLCKFRFANCGGGDDDDDDDDDD